MRGLKCSFIVFKIFACASLGAGLVLSQDLAVKDPIPPASEGAPYQAYFRDVAGRARLTAQNVFGQKGQTKYILETTGNGVALFDFDSDGWLDVFLVNGWRLQGFSPSEDKPTNHLYRNNRDGTFTDVTRAAGLARSGWGQGVCVGDWDNDGFEDLFVTYFGRNVLYRNRGDGTFQDTTRQAGLPADEERWSTGCAFLDADRDGDLDLFVARYLEFEIKRVPAPGENQYCRWKGLPVMCGPRGLPKEINALYRNNGDRTFSDVSESSGISGAENYGFSPLVTDFNNDGWPDIYVAADSTANLLYVNQKDGTFREEGIYLGAAFSEEGRTQAGMGVAAADYDRDGRFDIFVTNFSDDYHTLYRNLEGPFFVDTTHDAGLLSSIPFLGWGTGFFDFDHDGWKDLFAANGHVYPEVSVLGEYYEQEALLYRNIGNGKFEDVSRKSGPGIVERHSGRGVAFGDIDNDGQVEIVINCMNERPVLLDDRARGANSLVIRLRGTHSNRSAIGARVMLEAPGFRQADEVRSGGSYLSNNDFRLHFGVGNADRIHRLKVQWPGGKVDQVSSVETNGLITIVEGQGLTDWQPFAEPFPLWIEPH